MELPYWVVIMQQTPGDCKGSDNPREVLVREG
jgi:hypothetical protein